MNGDGIGDLIIGTRFADPAGPNSGQAYVIFGNTGPFATALELSALDGSNGFTINGLQSDNRTGNAVSGAGDINGDGLDDVILGAYYAEPTGSTSGQAYLIFGRTGAFPATLCCRRSTAAAVLPSMACVRVIAPAVRSAAPAMSTAILWTI
jgi:hypothetical protein